MAFTFRAIKRLIKRPEDPLVAEIRDLRKEIRSKVEQEILGEYEEARRQGKHPWEGLWLTRNQVEQVIKLLRRKDKLVLLEITAVLLIVLGLAYLLYWLMGWFLLPT